MFARKHFKRSLTGVSIALAVLLAGAGQAMARFCFGEPENLGPVVNSPYWQGGPSISADGLSLFFPSDRSGGSGSGDLWMTTRATNRDFLVRRIAWRLQALAQDDWRITHTMSVFGASLSGQGQFGAVRSLLASSYEQMKDNPDTPPDRVNEAVQRIIDLYEASDKPEQAAEWRAKSRAE